MYKEKEGGRQLLLPQMKKCIRTRFIMFIERMAGVFLLGRATVLIIWIYVIESKGEELCFCYTLNLISLGIKIATI